MTQQGVVRTGIAGWIYAPWRGRFYPQGLRQAEELDYASRHLGVIEINGTFRRFQSPKDFNKWSAATPNGFVFAIKGHQVVTHFKRLVDVEQPLADFFASGVMELGPKLGPICWQLPDSLKFDPDRMENFAKLLPMDAAAAEALAARHSDRLKTPPSLSANGITSLRHVIEVRHESYRSPEFIALMRRHNLAVVISDTAGWPETDLTADFAYLRLQGPPAGGEYDEAALDAWAATIAGWRDGRQSAGPDRPLIAEPMPPAPRDVYCLFVRENKEDAPANAMALAERVAAA